MVNNSDTKVSYQGNGQTTVFPFSFPFIQRDYIKVAIYDSLTDETKTIDSDYYVDTVANAVIYPGYEPGQEPAEALRPPILPATSTITIYRQTDVDQLTNLGDKYPLKDIENMADKLTEIIQEQAETLGRAVKVPVGDPKTPEEKLTDLQNYVKAAADSAADAADSESSAQRAAEAAATSEANAAESERLAGGYADTATAAAGRAEDSAISARAYNAPDYDNAKTYQAGEVVTYTDGNSYRALQETTGNEPPNIIYWQKVTDYVGDDFFEVDEYGYIVPMDSPSHSRYWRVDQNGYIVPIEGGDGGYRPDTRSLSAEYLNVTNEGYIKHLRADDIAAQEVDADEVTAEVAAFNLLTANAVNAGNINAYLAESTGYGIVSGCEPSISGLTVTVGAGIIHFADGTRKELSATNITLDSADPTNPRIDLVYIDSTGAVAKVTGTAAASPSVPPLPSGGISVVQVIVAAGSTTGVIQDVRHFVKYPNADIVTPEMFGAIGDGVTDDTIALKNFMSNSAKIKVFTHDKTYLVSSVIPISQSNVKIFGNGATIKDKENISNPNIIYVYAFDNDVSNVCISDLYLDGNKENQTTTSTMELIRIYCGNSKKIHDIIIDRCKLKDNVGHGIGVYNDNSTAKDYAYNITIKHCNISNVSVGVCQSKVSTSIVESEINNTGAESITIDNGCNKCSVINNKLTRANHGGNIGLDEASEVVIAGNIIDGTGSTASTDNKIGVAFNSHTGLCTDITIVGNVFKNHTAGISVGTPWSGNVYPSTAKNCVITGNAFKSCTYAIRGYQYDADTRVNCMTNSYIDVTNIFGYSNLNSNLCKAFRTDAVIYGYNQLTANTGFTITESQIYVSGNKAKIIAKVNITSVDSEGWKTIVNLPFAVKKTYNTKVLLDSRDLTIFSNKMAIYAMTSDVGKSFCIDTEVFLE